MSCFGPNYDIDADGEFRIQGTSKHLVKVMTQTVILRKGGHNACQIDCDELLNQFTQVAGAETAGGSQQFDKRKRPKTRKEVEIPFENDIDENENIADLPEIPAEVLNEFLNKNLQQTWEQRQSQQGPSQPNSNEVHLVKIKI